MSNKQKEFHELLAEACQQNKLSRAVFSSPRSSVSETIRVHVKPIELRGYVQFQFCFETSTQQVHKNFSSAEAATEMVRLAKEEFRILNFAADNADFVVQHSRKGKCFFKKLSSASDPKSLTSPSLNVAHNRAKNHLIPDGTPCPFLIRTGLMAPSGKVHAAHTRKFRQINRYLEFIQDIVTELPIDREISIIDFGCGKSYLTFAMHYLFCNILGRKVNIVGLDRRQDVVEHCSQIASDLELSGLRFAFGNIRDYETEQRVDMVISLHACDTATDDALFQSVQWQSNVILAVPCCQHELNDAIGRASMPPITSYGIAKERFASLVTDTMRASLMTAVGYPTQVLEFIETEHTPKNLLLRSVRQESGSMSAMSSAIERVRALRAMLGVGPLSLERQLSQYLAQEV